MNENDYLLTRDKSYFFIERVEEDKKEEAKTLLSESFEKQATGTFNIDYLNELMHS